MILNHHNYNGIMPRSTDYKKCVMYVIRHPVEGLEYVGHTTNFTGRKYDHKKKVKNGTCPVYKAIRECGGWDAWEMVLIEEYPCETLTQARIREEQLRVGRGSTLNKLKAYISDEERKEYRKTYNDTHAEEHKKYHEENKEKRNEYTRKWREENKAHSQEYFKQNRDKINAQRRERRKIKNS